MLDHGERAIAVIFQFENPIGIIECSGPLQERHWQELKELHHKESRIAGHGGSIQRGGFWVVVPFRVHRPVGASPAMVSYQRSNVSFGQSDFWGFAVLFLHLYLPR